MAPIRYNALVPAFGSLGFAEIVLILIVAILVWGRDLPKVLRQAGQIYARARRQLWDIRYEIEHAIQQEERPPVSTAPPLPWESSPADGSEERPPGST